MLRDFKRRRLCGMNLVVSDDLKGLKKAVQRHFQGIRWQRCQVHFLRNILGHAPASKRGPLAMTLGWLFPGPIRKKKPEASKMRSSDLFKEDAQVNGLSRRRI
jgi:transposase-like protein